MQLVGNGLWHKALPPSAVRHGKRRSQLVEHSAIRQCRRAKGDPCRSIDATGCRCRAAVRTDAPIGFPVSYTVPSPIRHAQQLVQTDTITFWPETSHKPVSADEFYEPMHIGMLCRQRPIKPTGLVVLGIGIVIALLGTTDLVTHQNHRQAQ